MNAKIISRIAYVTFSLTILPCLLVAQQSVLKGQIKDVNGETIVGASIIFDGTTKGTITDINGNYTIDNIDPGTYQVNYSFVGFKTAKEAITFTAGQTVTKDVTLESDVMLLDELVVIGYGTTNTKDLTGSTKLITEKDFGSGNVTTPEQLITGKVSGVQITSNDGAPGSGSRIRIRGGTSLNASNDPLIVIDDVPVDNEDISGAANALNLINPADIANVVILKDASAAAIYGSRGANGVILITTKKGELGANGGNTGVNIGLQQKFSLSTISTKAEVMSASELTDVINQFGTQDQIDLLGDSNTDWQDEIYRNAFISETNLSLSGAFKKIPYRFSAGYKHEEGLLKRHQLDRTALALNLNPKFLDDHLAVNLNTKFTIADNFFANQDAIGAAVSFDPTQPVLSGSEDYGGYFEWLNPNTLEPNNLAGKNPVGLLEQKEDISDVNRFIGNLKLDYKLHFFPDIIATLNVGGDFVSSNGSVTIPAEAASKFLQGGERSQYEQTKENRLLEAYFNYVKSIENINSDFDFTAGYSYQNWVRESPAFDLLNIAGDVIIPAGIPSYNENTLISFYGRLKYTFNDKYLLTGTLRRDGSSRFNPDQRWGMFPSAAFAWRVSDENFLIDSKTISYLKLRAGYGVTGQQDIVDNDYPYLANYSGSTTTAQYQFGTQFYSLLRPDGFDLNIKWEETTSTNLGIDFGFMKDRVFGSLDYYFKETKDLLAVVDVPAGVNFTNEILTNVGALKNQGVELELSFVAIAKAATELTIGINGTMNKNEVTKLTNVENDDSPGILVGGIDGGIGNNVQIHAVGSPTNSFYVYEQLYDGSGNPIEGGFADLNNDGIINEKDRYILEKPAPDLYAGFYTNFRHKEWTVGFSLRGEFDRYVYNNVNSNRGYFEAVPSQDYIVNLNNSFNESGFIGSSPEQFLSDYYIEKANFVRMDYFNVAYDFGEVFSEKARLNAAIVVNNVFVLSDYSGIDPEIADGIDKNIYPRPRIFSLNLNFNF